jgi:hypothetical protein
MDALKSEYVSRAMAKRSIGAGLTNKIRTLAFLVQLVVVEEVIAHDRAVSDCTTAAGASGRAPPVRPDQELRNLDGQEALNREPPPDERASRIRSAEAPRPHLVG